MFGLDFFVYASIIEMYLSTFYLGANWQSTQVIEIKLHVEDDYWPLKKINQNMNAKNIIAFPTASAVAA